jgi:hypothetical protein
MAVHFRGLVQALQSNVAEFYLFCGIFVHLIIDLPCSVVYIIEISAAQPEYNRITFKILYNYSNILF